MTSNHRPSISGNIAISAAPQENGQFCCQLTSSLESLVDGQTGEPKSFYGQSQNHAIAIALEYLAEQYRKAAEAEQDISWDTVERSNSGTVIDQRYHVILHYERIAEEESKFEALHNTIMGNTVVENASITIIQVDSELPVQLVGEQR